MAADAYSNPSLDARLTAFLTGAQPLLRQIEEERDADIRSLRKRWKVLGEGRMTELIGDLGPAVRAARGAGAFANPWRIAGLKRREVVTTAVLAWFLSPDEDHGAGSVFLDAFWKATGLSDVFPLVGVSRCDAEFVPLADDANRVDLVLQGRDCLVFIEVKIDAPFQPNQLSRYQASLHARRQHLGLGQGHLILLGGLAAPDAVDCCVLTWSQMAGALREGARALSHNLYTARLASDFAAHVAGL